MKNLGKQIKPFNVFHYNCFANVIVVFCNENTEFALGQQFGNSHAHTFTMQNS